MQNVQKKLRRTNYTWVSNLYVWVFRTAVGVDEWTLSSEKSEFIRTRSLSRVIALSRVFGFGVHEHELTGVPVLCTQLESVPRPKSVYC